MGIFELLPVDDDIRLQIQSRGTAADIKAAAVRAGMQTLRADGMAKVRRGWTALEEVLRVTMDQ